VRLEVQQFPPSILFSATGGSSAHGSGSFTALLIDYQS